MSEWAWINGEVMPLSEARVGVEDRGFQFADGVYEVIRVYQGRPFTLVPHLERLARSCRGIDMALPMSRDVLAGAIHKTIDRNELRGGMVYLQVTRGVAERNHLFPASPSSTVVCYARALPPVRRPGEGEGLKLLSVPDERWRRCWIKSIALLPNVLAKNRAAAAGADEAVFVDSGIVTECSASNLFAVIGSKLVTHPVGPKVLPGVTRAVLVECAGELGIEVEERALREEEAVRASEVFITSTTREVGWVARWDEHPVGEGRCGPVTIRLHQALRDRIRQETGDQ